MASLADCLTVTIRRERDRARRELDAEREAHRAALESERLAYEARAKALQAEIDALADLRAEMRIGLEEAGNEQERLQDLLETAEQARRDTEDTLEQTRAQCDELIAELAAARADAAKERQARDQASRPRRRGDAGGGKAPVPVVPATGESSQPSQPTGPAATASPVGTA